MIKQISALSITLLLYGCFSPIAMDPVLAEVQIEQCKLLNGQVKVIFISEKNKNIDAVKEVQCTYPVLNDDGSTKNEEN